MRKVNLGSCCLDCFYALNFDGTDDKAIKYSAAALSKLADAEGMASLHTGDETGFSWSACGACGQPHGGARWELYGLEERKDIA